ncbi:MAG: hypothetical protein D6781_09810 [Verrucomicrobia bacterium]|nr:MAG: hypothetical protein D6781_09810 [Verrucomicrobiota bacterium]
MARSMLGHNLSAINPDGSITPVEGEEPRSDEPGHAALAIGEFYRATGETTLDGVDLVDLAARCITAQAFSEPAGENGLAYAALALLSFGPSKERNVVWERLVDETRQRLDRQLLHRSDYDNHWQAFNIAKAVCRYSLGLSRKDETGRLIERFVSRIKETSSAGFFDDCDSKGIGGNFDIYGPMSFVFIRQALQLHANAGLRERKLPTLRTFAEKYIKLLPDLVRHDGLGWGYGRSAGAYGQMHCISLLLQSFRDNWIAPEQQERYFDILRRLFYFFYVTYLDQEHGYLVIRDAERATVPQHTTRMANFDGARYLCQWSRLARQIDAPENPKPQPARTAGRYVIFDKSNRKEQGLFLYRDAESGLHIQLPLVGMHGHATADGLPFPHCPGIFDWPSNVYLPILLPELQVGEHRFIPAFYGKRCSAGLGVRNSFFFRYEQPEWINTNEEIVPGLGTCKVSWTFSGNKVTSDFIYTVKSQVQLDQFRYVLAIGSPHSQYHTDSSPMLGEAGLRCAVVKDDFQGIWTETEVVTNDPAYRSNYGNIHYLQTLIRDHPLIMRPGNTYRLTVTFEPDISIVG